MERWPLPDSALEPSFVEPRLELVPALDDPEVETDAEVEEVEDVADDDAAPKAVAEATHRILPSSTSARSATAAS